MNRKDEHVSLAKAFHNKQKNEFDTVRIVHNALPQLAVSEVSLHTSVAGLDLHYPFYINARNRLNDCDRFSECRFKRSDIS